ncbi:MAG TPA: hypothetical protein VKU82_16235, partial [Planctomycetaceae bacterium]|nr:hypothetical protein [Planctomycetaceae bacterium]
IIAFLVWAPWLWALQSKGGYAAVAANHRGYIVGLADWLSSFNQQSAKLNLLDGWLSMHALLAAVLVSFIHLTLSTQRSTWNIVYENRALFLGLPIAMGLSLVVAPSAILGLLAALGVALLLLRRPAGMDSRETSPRRLLAGWLVAAWLVGLFLTTPLYVSYPRLMLPWLAACWLGAGLFLDVAVRSGEKRTKEAAGYEVAGSSESAFDSRFALTPALKQSTVVGIVVGALLITCVERYNGRISVPGWESRVSLSDAVSKLLMRRFNINSEVGRDVKRFETPDLNSFVIYTYAEPAAFFQLRLARVRWVRPVKDLHFASFPSPRSAIPRFLLLGERSIQAPGFAESLGALRLSKPSARHDASRVAPEFAEQVDAKSQRLVSVAQIAYPPDALLSLDESNFGDSSNERMLEFYYINDR